MKNLQRKKQAVEEVPLEMMMKAVEAYNTARKNKLKAAHFYSRKVTRYKFIKQWKNVLNKVAQRKAK